MKKTLTLFAVATLLAGCGETYDSTTGTESSPAINEPSGSSLDPGTTTNDNSSGTSGAATNQYQTTTNTPTTP